MLVKCPTWLLDQFRAAESEGEMGRARAAAVIWLASLDIAVGDIIEIPNPQFDQRGTIMLYEKGAVQ